MKRPIAIWGGFGGYNLGDEAILRSTVQGIARCTGVNPRTVIVPGLACPDWHSHYASMGLSVVILDQVPTVIRTLATHNLVVGGGQLIDDVGWRWPLGATAYLLTINRLLGGAPICIGLGALSVRQPVRKLIARVGLSFAKQIACRDAESSTFLLELGIDSAKVVVTEDVVLSYGPTRRKLTADRSGVFHLVLAPGWDPRRPHADLTDVYAEQVARVVSVHDKVKITIVAHDTRPEYDIVAGTKIRESIVSRMPNLQVGLFSPQNLDALMDLYLEADAVISSRLHPLLLGGLSGAVPIAAGSSSKVLGAVARLGFPTIAEMQSPDDWSTRMPHLRTRIVSALEARKSASLQNFELVRIECMDSSRTRSEP